MKILRCTDEYRFEEVHPLKDGCIFLPVQDVIHTTHALALVGFDLVKEYENGFTGPDWVSLNQHSFSKNEAKQMSKEDKQMSKEDYEQGKYICLQ